MTPASITLPTLIQLAAITGGRADPERLGTILHQMAQTDDEPLDQLVAVAPEAGFRVTPIRQKLSEALWHARQDLPELVRALAILHPQLTVDLQPAIGENPMVIDLIANLALGEQLTAGPSQ